MFNGPLLRVVWLLVVSEASRAATTTEAERGFTAGTGSGQGVRAREATDSSTSQQTGSSDRTLRQTGRQS